MNDLAPGARGHRSVVLVATADPAARAALAGALRQEGCVVEQSVGSDQAMSTLTAIAPDVLVTELTGADAEGLELVRRARAIYPELIVVALAPQDPPEVAVRARRLGVEWCVTTPAAPSELVLLVDRAVEARRFRREVTELRAILGERLSLRSVLGASAVARDVEASVVRAAGGIEPVLISGPGAAPKELTAAAVHQKSSRRTQPFVSVACAAVDGALLEREIFGYEKGAFDGAIARRRGSLELAERGTLYLGDIGGAPVAVQRKLLRLLRATIYERMGGRETLVADVRIIASSSRELRAETATGTFSGELLACFATVIDVGHTPGRYPDAHVPPSIPGTSLEEIERFAIVTTFEAAGGSTSKTAQMLGISVRKVQYRLHEYGIATRRPQMAEAGKE